MQQPPFTEEDNCRSLLGRKRVAAGSGDTDEEILKTEIVVLGAEEGKLAGCWNSGSCP